ncbi:ACP S-malonyltransferase [Lolliginicoccus levis]|uniref:ACP S-malonyltransferase n=1 Tax=Lolliginicoccus levis TaxID=2919542 RepID=UPI00241F8ED3|nr:ACP S-malonyltransferase [Lolliginicoccus levis]
MIAIVFPGQGAQRPGGLVPWLEVPRFADALDRFADAAGLDLVALGTTADAATITDTSVAQPLIVATGIATARLLDLDPQQTVWAGHSVGELTAAALAGCLRDEDAVRLAAERGRAMAAASQDAPTGMSAVLGGEPTEVRAVLRALGLTPANLNGPDQIVAAGTVEQLDALRTAPPHGARVVALRVTGAFHSEHMRPAQERFARAVAAVRPAEPSGTLLSNADGMPISSGAEVLARLVRQVCAPVRWDLTASNLATLARHVVEVAPAGTLAGLLRRSAPTLDVVALRGPKDLPVTTTGHR